MNSNSNTTTATAAAAATAALLRVAGASSATPVHLINHPHPYVIFRHQLCRIPDVLFAMMLLPHRFTDDEVRANLLFYEGVTSPDSSLRFPVFATLAARLQMAEKAAYYFQRTLFVDLSNIMGDSAGGTHCTIAAGMWCTLVFGFAGMRVVYQTLHFNPSVPMGMTGYRFDARHQGCLLRVEVRKEKVTYTLLELHASCTAPSLSIVHGNKNRIELCVGAPASMQLVHPARIFGFDAMIFDLDSLLVNVEDVHYASWKTAFEEHFGNRDGESKITITKELYLAYLRHNVPLSGLREVFKKYNLNLGAVGHPTDSQEERTVYALCNRKLNVFRRYVQQNGLCVREGAAQLLSNLRESGVKLGCVSSSKNGRWVVDELPELHSVFDVVLDGHAGEQQKLRWRPEMEFFTLCARSLMATPKRCIIVVDGVDNYSKSCIENFRMVVDVSAEPEALSLSVTRLCTRNYKQLTSEVLNVYALCEDGGVMLGDGAADSRTTVDEVALSQHVDPNRA